MYQLDNKVFGITDARYNHEDPYNYFPRTYDCLWGGEALYFKKYL